MFLSLIKFNGEIGPKSNLLSLPNEAGGCARNKICLNCDKKLKKLKVQALLVSSSNTHICLYFHLRPYNRESTASRPICEVKHVLAQIVVRWVTTREVWVL